jgi:hypothetical protein
MAGMRIALASLLFATLVTGVGARADEQHTYPWQKPPGPIAGSWKVTCPYMAGMVVEFAVAGDKATGKIAVLGQGSIRTYKQGEEILHLSVDDFGEWSGKLVWRSAAGAQHEDAIRFVATTDKLNATMTTDECYKNMTRAH